MTGIVGWFAVALAASSLGSAAVVSSGSSESAQGYAQPSAWETYKVRLAMLAAQQGVSQATIRANVPSLTVNRSVIQMESTEPVARSVGGIVSQISPYLRSHVTPSLIRRGQANYSDHYQALRSLEARYGVDPAVLMAIWGHETSYGEVTGSTDLLNALASLGYYGRRRDFFESEFIAALKLMDQGVPRWRLKGSWAGAPATRSSCHRLR